MASILRPLLERRPQKPILVHPAERLIVLDFEMNPPRLKSIGDSNRENRTARLSEPISNSDGLKHAHGTRRNGAGPAIEGGILAQRGICWIDNDRGQSARIERRGEREADHSATKDDHIRTVHDRPLRAHRSDAKKFA